MRESWTVRRCGVAVGAILALCLGACDSGTSGSSGGGGLSGLGGSLGKLFANAAGGGLAGTGGGTGSSGAGGGGAGGTGGTGTGSAGTDGAGGSGGGATSCSGACGHIVGCVSQSCPALPLSEQDAASLQDDCGSECAGAGLSADEIAQLGAMSCGDIWAAVVSESPDLSSQCGASSSEGGEGGEGGESGTTGGGTTLPGTSGNTVATCSFPVGSFVATREPGSGTPWEGSATELPLTVDSSGAISTVGGQECTLVETRDDLVEIYTGKVTCFASYSCGGCIFFTRHDHGMFLIGYDSTTSADDGLCPELKGGQFELPTSGPSGGPDA